MDVWSDYKALHNQKGLDRRTRALNREKSYLNRKVPNSLSYKTVLVNGVSTDLAIISTTKMYQKKVCSMPEKTLVHGGLVDYANSKWIITSIDQESELYQKGLMEECNHILKWLNSDGDIIEKWCIVEDGTKYLIGEKTEEVISIGDARIAVTIPKDDDTKHLKRGMRFIIDDTESEEALTYEITKSNRLYNIYNGKGVYRFILKEDSATDKDNFELRIADYYKFYPKLEFYPDSGSGEDKGSQEDTENSDKEIDHNSSEDETEENTSSNGGWL